MRTIEEILNDMNALVATAEGRNFSDEEVSRYETLKSELQRAQNSAAIRDHNTKMNSPAGSVPRTGTGAPRREETIRDGFNAYLRTGQPNADISDLRVTNAQGEGGGAAGGYMVPTEFRAKIIDRMKAFGGIAPYVETVNTTTGAPIEWAVTLDDTANTGEVVAEHAAPATGADLVFDQVQLGAYRYATAGANADPLRVSVELLQDAAFDVEGLVSRKLGERLARIQAPGLIRGTGVGEPLGLITGRTPVQPNANTGPVYDDLITWEHSVDPAYRALGNCKWAMNDQSLAYFKKLKDSHGDPLWRPADADMATPTGGGVLNGYQVIIDQSFVDMDVDDPTDLWGAFGDFREGYVRRTVRDVVVIVNPWTRANNGQIEFSAWSRMDGTQQNVNAYIAMSGKT
jgi:HK97 family phage major capsid protein